MCHHGGWRLNLSPGEKQRAAQCRCHYLFPTDALPARCQCRVILGTLVLKMQSGAFLAKNQVTTTLKPALKSVSLFFLLSKGSIFKKARCAYIDSFTTCLHTACFTMMHTSRDFRELFSVILNDPQQPSSSAVWDQRQLLTGQRIWARLQQPNTKHHRPVPQEDERCSLNSTCTWLLKKMGDCALIGSIYVMPKAHLLIIKGLIMNTLHFAPRLSTA